MKLSPGKSLFSWCNVPLYDAKVPLYGRKGRLSKTNENGSVSERISDGEVQCQPVAEAGDVVIATTAAQTGGVVQGYT